jgi:hypothetical protein
MTIKIVELWHRVILWADTDITTTTLQLEGACFSETMVSARKSARCHNNSEDQS